MRSRRSFLPFLFVAGASEHPGLTFVARRLYDETRFYIKLYVETGGAASCLDYCLSMALDGIILAHGDCFLKVCTNSGVDMNDLSCEYIKQFP